MLGFDDYPDIAAKLRSILAGEQHHPHTPQDRRLLLPISPGRPRRVERGRARAHHRRARPARRCRARLRAAGRPPPARRRADGAAQAGQRLRPPLLVLRDPVASAARSSRGGPATCSARRAGSASRASSELFLVSENSTSYGKDLGDLRLLETLLPELAAVEGVERVRVSYLQPAETRPGLVTAIASTPGVAPYFDLSFQHASNAVLRRMRRFGDPEQLPRPARADPLPGPAGRHPLQRDRRLPRRDRGGPGHPVRLPGRGPDGRGRGVRLLRRGRHRGGGRTTASSTRTRSASAPSTSPGSSRSSPPSAPRSGSANASRCCWSRSTATSPRAAPPTRARRSTAPPRSSGLAGARVGDFVAATVVTGSDGADLVAEAAP